MLYKKSFNLNNEESQTRKSEKLYQPKKFRWCKYIVVPFLIGFILLLILTNVDFNGNAYDQTWLEIEDNNLTGNYNIINDLSPARSTMTRDALECINSSNFCTLTCQDGNVNNLYKLLEPLYNYCGVDMVLILKNCNFPGGTLTSDFFEGNFRLKELNITDCNLTAIAEKAFLQDSLRGLKNLYVMGSQFETLEPTSFEGLEELENFQMQNLPVAWTTFKGYDFLKPFSQTLTQVFLQQQTTEAVAYDPYNWLRGAAMQSLQMVNLSNNNFQNLLNDQTFSTLVAVKKLYLSNCFINYLPSNVFEGVLHTLQHLDLSDNHLTTLPAEMLLNMNGLNLCLNFNYWDCTCENEEILMIIQNNVGNINYLEKEYLKCYTPQDVKDVRIDELSLDCLSETTLPVYETTYDLVTTDASSESDKSTTSSESEMETIEVTSEETNKSYESTTYRYETSTSESYSTSTPDPNETTETETIETSEETNESIESTTHRYETTSYSTSTTYSTSTSAPFQPTVINCKHSSDNTNFYRHVIRKEICSFVIYSLTKTSVSVVLAQFLSNIEVFYFTNSTRATTKSTERSITHWPRQQFIYSIEITDLDPKTLYVFCLIQNKQSKISPFDCKGFVMPEDLPQPWILNDDQTWILCLVVLGICLMLLLGIVVMIIVERFKKRRNLRSRNKNSDTQMSSNCNNGTSSRPHRNLGTTQRSSANLYRSQHQPPDVISPHVNYNIDNDSYVYEDLTM